MSSDRAKGHGQQHRPQRGTGRAARGKARATKAESSAAAWFDGCPAAVQQHWRDGDWQGLQSMLETMSRQHALAAPLVSARAVAELELDRAETAHGVLSDALERGQPATELSTVLVANAHRLLGRAFIAAGRRELALRHFELASDVDPDDSEFAAREARQAGEHLDGLARADELRRLDATAELEVRATADLKALVRSCIDADDPLEAIADATDAGAIAGSRRAVFLTMVADAFRAQGDTLRALHYMNAACEHAPTHDRRLRIAIAGKLASMRRLELALDFIVEDALAEYLGAREGALFDGLCAAIRNARRSQSASSEHGHDLLLAWLSRDIRALKASGGGRRLRVIEVGTTREEVPGQGSTRKLAQFCVQHGLDFVTVDMDPENSRAARRMFAKLGASFDAVTDKGEDYLAALTGPVDFVFLDAYDFDHGEHSALRQSRYERFLGAGIDEQACHRMHLDCAVALASRLSAFGLVCIDDTWIEDGRWTAKGTLAVPYLLEHGFTVLEARNRAALMKRCAGE